MTSLKVIADGITAVPGFLASGVKAGIKKDKLDLALIYSPQLATVAGVFTTNVVKAAPLQLGLDQVKEGYSHGVVVNSGNANACNGPQGLEDAKIMAATAAEALGVKAEQIFVSSTGVIGENLPMDKITPGIIQAAAQLTPTGGGTAAQAIMTTDTITKEIAVQVEIGGSLITIGGMAKGSGMINPNMATMLAYIATDAVVVPDVLQSALNQAVDTTFNMITVDGDTSTNDTVLVFANGAAQQPPLVKDTPAYDSFVSALTKVCRHLARAIARDGEGATKLVAVTVKNAASLGDARKVAKTVVGSNLFKAAIFGQDANWGRILCAAGYSGVDFDPESVDIYLGPVQVAQRGVGLFFNEQGVLAVLGQDEVTVTVDLKAGDHSATAWGCDLTYEYVRINGSYRT